MAKSKTGKPLIERLRDLRKRHSLSQEQFSELAGIGYKYYQLVDGGKRIDMRLSTLQKLAGAYGIQVHELLAPEMPSTNLPRRIPSKRKGRPPTTRK